MEKIPHPDQLRQKLKALATIDALLCNQWDLRYFSFNAHWAENEELGSMRNGEGDDFFVLFFRECAAIKGASLEHKYLAGTSFIKVARQQIPKEFGAFLTEPAFSMKEATFIYWHSNSWQEVISPKRDHRGDGSAYLMQWIIWDEFAHTRWVKEYYDIDIDPTSIAAVFSGQIIDQVLLTKFGFDGDITELTRDLAEIGYPQSLK